MARRGQRARTTAHLPFFAAFWATASCRRRSMSGRQPHAALPRPRDRVRPAEALRERRVRRPSSGIVTRRAETRLARNDRGIVGWAAPGANAPRARPEGDAPDI